MQHPTEDPSSDAETGRTRPTRRRAVWWLAAGTAVAATTGVGTWWRSRWRRRAAVDRLWRTDPEQPCRPLVLVNGGRVSTDRLDSLALEIARLYPWHDARDLRPLTDPTRLCANAPPARAELYPELARCWEVRDDVVRLLAGQTSGPRDVVDAVTAALERHRRGDSRLTLQGPAGIAFDTSIRLRDTAPFVARRLLDAPQVLLEAVSTAPLENALGDGLGARAARLVGRPHAGPATRPTAALYAEAYGVDPTAVPAGVVRLRQHLEALTGAAVDAPERLWLGDFRIRVGRLSALPTDRYLDLDRHIALFALADRARPAVTRVARRLSAAHPWIPSADFEATVLANLLTELFWLGPEDPWQDVGAAEAFDAPTAPALRAAVDRARRVGDVAVGPLRGHDGQVVDLRIPGAWRLATALGAPLEFQGLGPAQLIVGLVLEAGRWPVDGEPLWRSYFPERRLDVAEVVAVALDLEDAVAATGLVYDYLLRRMDASILAAPETAYPCDLYPFPPDRNRARRLLALSLLRTLKAFPEMLWRYPNPHSFPYWHHAFNQDALTDTAAVAAAVWSLDAELGSTARVAPARAWRRPLIDHFGTADRSDALQVVSLPAGATGGLGPLRPV